MKKKIDKKEVIQSINKMLSNKANVVAYIKGNTDLSSLTKKGIKFAKPL